MPSGGFIAVRRGLLEHLRRGKLTELEALTFIIILGLANPHSGIWWGSAKSLWGEYPFYGNERRARRALEGLASKWYIKRLSTPGKHSNYPILIDKYEVKVGDKVGLRLNARKSSNERALRYEKIGARQGEGELGVMPVGEQVVKVGVFGGGQTPSKGASIPPLLKKEKENEKKKDKEHRAQASPSPYGWKHLRLTEEQIKKLESTYKWAAVETECAKMDAWMDANPERKKKNHYRFAVNWLNGNSRESFQSTEASKQSAVGRGPRTEGKPRKCECGAEIPAGFLKCLKCMKAKK